MQKRNKTYLVENSTIDFIDKTTILKFKINSNELHKIISDKIFNYKDEIFLEPPSSDFKTGNISIISDQKNCTNYDAKSFKINQELWYILDLKLEDIMIKSFYGMKINGELNSDLAKAVYDFELQKTKYNTVTSENKKTVQNLLNNLIEAKGKVNNLEQIAENFVAEIVQNESLSMANSIITNFLNDKKIPFDKILNNYNFSVSSEKNTWVAELTIEESISKILLLSSIEIKTNEKNVKSIIQDLNEINSQLKIGRAYISQKNTVLNFKNEIDLNNINLESKLGNLIETNFNSMDSIVQITKANHDDKVKIINY